jgi:tetratricopeptide (TPR) repeat protein
MEKTGNTATLSSYAPALGRVLCLLGQHDEAELLAQKGRELGDPEDLLTQAMWRQTQALVHSARGQHTEAERLAREAVDYSLRGDSLSHQGEAFNDLAEVLEAAGRHEEAIAALQDALDRYERKQVIPLARRTSERLTALLLAE